MEQRKDVLQVLIDIDGTLTDYTKEYGSLFRGVTIPSHLAEKFELDFSRYEIEDVFGLSSAEVKELDALIRSDKEIYNRMWKGSNLDSAFVGGLNKLIKTGYLELHVATGRFEDDVFSPSEYETEQQLIESGLEFTSFTYNVQDKVSLMKEKGYDLLIEDKVSTFEKAIRGDVPVVVVEQEYNKKLVSNKYLCKRSEVLHLLNALMGIKANVKRPLEIFDISSVLTDVIKLDM